MPRSTVATADSGDLGVTVARHIDIAEVGGVALELRAIDLEDHAILVALRVDGRNLALREGVVERVVDILNAHAKTRGGGAVDLDIDLQAALLAVRIDVGEVGQSSGRDPPPSVPRPATRRCRRSTA